MPELIATVCVNTSSDAVTFDVAAPYGLEEVSVRTWREGGRQTKTHGANGVIQVNSANAFGIRTNERPSEQ